VQEEKTKLPAGFTMRGATMEDLEAAVVLFNQISQHYLGIDEISRRDVIGNEWQAVRLV
jgi:hypothetical protein